MEDQHHDQFHTSWWNRTLKVNGFESAGILSSPFSSSSSTSLVSNLAIYGHDDATHAPNLNSTGWNQELSHGEESAETSFRPVLGHSVNPYANFQQESGQELQWRERLYYREHSFSMNEFKPIKWDFPFHDQKLEFSPLQYSSSDDSTVTCQGLLMDSSASNLYASSPLTMFPSLLGARDHHASKPRLPLPQAVGFMTDFSHSSSSSASNFVMCCSNDHDQSDFNAWSKVPEFHNPLDFNHTSFWKASEAAMRDGYMTRPSQLNFPSAYRQLNSTPTLAEKQKNASEVHDSGTMVMKRSSSGSNSSPSKRTRNEKLPITPDFKVKKDKMMEREKISAMQQLVAPFGKTDQASVLSDATECIKYLHEQVRVLSSPYMKIGASLQHHHHHQQIKGAELDAERGLRSRGLCLVPIANILFPVSHGHNTLFDPWTTPFGPTFR